MKITFLGAAGCVTGSKFLIEHGSKHVLMDAGLYQERDLLSRNWDVFPFNPVQIDAVLLTHAHIDHCGYLPKLVRSGFRGKIYCTAPTREIAKVALIDSAKLQEEDATYKLKRHKKEGRKGRYPEAPLYTEKDARAVFPMLRKVNYGEPLGLSNDLSVTFYDAGHILGSAMIEIKAATGVQQDVWLFSGDIGRPHKPILKDPHVFTRADHVVMEATYGNRRHDDAETSLEKFAEIINVTAERGGKVLIPSFAINRTQEVMYHLDQLLDAQRIPRLPLYVDSPMAADVTEIYDMYPQEFDDEAKAILQEERSLFHYPLLKIITDPRESRALNHLQGPAIIMAGSGMCNGGRIKHHLFHQIAKPENTLLFMGFQAKGTLGRILIDKPQQVRILGQTIPVRARIEKINGFSAHADRDELLQWISGVKTPIKKVFIVHAEDAAAQEFAVLLREKLHTEVIVPGYGDVG